MKKALKLILLWGITIAALYYAFYAADWNELIAHLKGANRGYLLLAISLTVVSYLLRSRRWQFLFVEKPAIGFANAWRVLVLGFFMNNVIPARAGELIRAHLGSKVTNLSRTSVLATIASERLLDGLTLSLLFVGFSFGIKDSEFSADLFYVASLFAIATLGVALVLVLRKPIFSFIERINDKLNHKAADFTLKRIQIFIEGLSPLFQLSRLPILSMWSIVIWLVELWVYIAIGKAYGVTGFGIHFFVLFLVTVNFSSLIPAAPGGIGVIEAVTKTVLVSVGMDPELALALVITQHVIQYLVIAIPGIFLLFTWRDRIKDVKEQPNGAVHV